MGVRRIRQYPYPGNIQSLEGVRVYLGKLARAIQDEAVQRIEDFNTLSLSNVSWVDVRDYGAVAGAGIDNTAAIQAAVNVVLALPYGGTVFFPPGLWQVTHLNLSNALDLNIWTSPSIRLKGAGIKATRLEGTLNGAILIDCLGRDFVHIEDMQLGTDGTAIYQTGILLARRDPNGQECSYNKFSRVYVRGDFSIAAVVSIAGENTAWYDCILENDDPTNNYCAFFTSPNNNVAGIVSTHGTILPSTNTNNLFVGTWFWTNHANATLLIFDESAEYTFIRCTGIVGSFTGTKFATYVANAAGGVFYGRVNWIGTLWECSGGGTVHYFTGPGAYSHYHDVSDVGGTFGLGVGAAYVIDTDGNPARFYNFRVQDMRSNMGAGGTLNIDANGVYNCHFDIYSPTFNNRINVTEFQQGSTFKANVLDVQSSYYTTTPITVAMLQCYGDILTNAGAGADVHFDLPVAAIGMNITFYNVYPFTITIDPNGTDQIMVLTGVGGDYLRSDGVIGSYIKLACLLPNKWYKTDMAGTWTEE